MWSASLLAAFVSLAPEGYTFLHLSDWGICCKCEPPTNAWEMRALTAAPFRCPFYHIIVGVKSDLIYEILDLVFNLLIF